MNGINNIEHILTERRVVDTSFTIIQQYKRDNKEHGPFIIKIFKNTFFYKIARRDAQNYAHPL